MASAGTPPASTPSPTAVAPSMASEPRRRKNCGASAATRAETNSVNAACQPSTRRTRCEAAGFKVSGSWRWNLSRSRGFRARARWAAFEAGPDRKDHPKRRALADFARDLDAPAVHFAQAPGNREAEARTGAPRARFSRLEILLEDRIVFLGRDAGARVGDVDDHVVCLDAEANVHVAVLGVFHGIADDVADDLAHATPVRVRARRPANERDDE